ncbi:type III secretion protein [bacterium]|nr:type III secretion protein [bacterium]
MSSILQEQFLLTFLRIFGGVLILPGGYAIIPLAARVSLALSLAFICVPLSVDEHFQALPVSYPIEVLIGLSLVFPISLVAEVFRTLGELLEQARGQNLGMMYGASTDMFSENPFPRLLQMSFICGLFITGIHTDYLILLFESFEKLPVGHTIWHQGFLEFSSQFLHYSFQLFVTGLTIFLPIGFIFMLCDIGVGFLSKLVPGLPIFGELFFVKSGILLILLITSFSLLHRDIAIELAENAARMARQSISAFGG